MIIQIDKVVSEGVCSGVFSLRNGQGTKKEGSSRTLEIEITWSNKTSNENTTDRLSSMMHDASV